MFSKRYKNKCLHIYWPFGNNRIRQIAPGDAEAWPGGARSGCQVLGFSDGPFLWLVLANIKISCWEKIVWRGIVILTAATLKCWLASFNLGKAKESSMAKPNHNHFSFCYLSLQILTFLKFHNPTYAHHCIFFFLDGYFATGDAPMRFQ